MQQHTVADAVYLVEHLAVGLCYTQRTAEAAGTLNLKLHVVQQQIVVVLVAGLFTGIARTAHTGSTVQRQHLQAGVIGNTGLAQLLCIIGSLLSGIGSKGAACFRRCFYCFEICQIFDINRQILH